MNVESRVILSLDCLKIKPKFEDILIELKKSNNVNNEFQFLNQIN